MSLAEDQPIDTSYVTFKRIRDWCEHLDDPNLESFRFFKPFTPRQLASLELVRSLTAELAAKRAEDEKAAALAAAAESVQPEAEAAEEEDEPAAPVVSQPAKQLPSRCVPARNVNADESLFTKYA